MDCFIMQSWQTFCFPLNKIDPAQPVDKHRSQRYLKPVSYKERNHAAHETCCKAGACKVHEPYHSKGITAKEAGCQADYNKNNSAGTMDARFI